MKQLKIYLAGPILHALKDNEHSIWREEAKEKLEELGHKVFLPLEMYEFCERMGVPKTEKAFEQIITVRDRWFCQRSDLILANFGPGGMDKASIGTCIELGWSDSRGVPVLGVLPEGNIHNHPIIDALLTWKVSTMEEALAIVTALGEGFTEKVFEFTFETMQDGPIEESAK